MSAAAKTSGAEPVIQKLSPRQKAAVILRLLVEDGETPNLTAMTPGQQALLTEEMARLKPISRATLESVITEFLNAMDEAGLSVSHGLASALNQLSGHISAEVEEELRLRAGLGEVLGVWDRLAALPADTMLKLIDGESPEVAAVVLSKIKVAVAAEILGLMPGPRARRITFAVSQTEQIAPPIVERIGEMLVDRLEAIPPRAFNRSPDARLGEILNSSAPDTREEVLNGLQESDEGFAKAVRKAIFTFAHISTRVVPRDVPALLKEVDGDVLVKALKSAETQEPDTAAFLLENMSKRMAEQLREAMKELGDVPEKDGNAAMTEVVRAVRKLEADGTLMLIPAED
ncbi:flagellar motor switch protein FliG [Tropicimonas sp. S265A]|uniref:flagellar motor switch protein FliG n=1 Tax=Tropicimonas sp. S265A TaxID=3415134 RepID=UPI003C7BCCD9